MTLREFTDSLNNYILENPQMMDLPVVAASDDEGNSFSEVFYTPSKGMFKPEDGSFYTELKEGDDKPNATCIN